jgi:hypothetical protein
LVSTDPDCRDELAAFIMVWAREDAESAIEEALDISALAVAIISDVVY